ncbi:hypothetical protein Prum_042620 [Phytohabitans rumicis]|uniref:DoxX family protein n=1 Tax=Phytohabitans rumicis TaxID=1076125 RepID=A0A6V8L4Z0_9ACTN|nr:hypothetical protein Prum_042620 [Phytohabitans rumicis]
MRPVRTAARALLSGIFVASGARALADPEQLVPRAKVVTDRVAPLLERVDPRIPTEARTLVQLNGAMQVAGGLLLATGHFTRAAAAVLAGTMVPTTLAGHPFWTYEDPAERRVHQVQFLKNLGLVGGLLFAAVDTRGVPACATGLVTLSAIGAARWGARSARCGATRELRSNRPQRHATCRDNRHESPELHTVR